MKKTKLTPDPLRDPPKGQGEYQCPGPHMIMPARAYGDIRFNRFPMTFRVLGVCCSHANSWTGVFFPNQEYVANVLQCSQQAVSQHMRKLVEFRYIEKLRNEDARRSYGKRGALWRVIYDPTQSFTDCVAKMPAQDRDPQIEAEVAKHTLNVTNKSGAKRRASSVDKSVDKGKEYKAGVVQAGACNTVKDGEKNKVGLVPTHKAELVDNSINITSKEASKEINEIQCRKLCNSYAVILQSKYGKPWQYDLKQMQIARELLQAGYTQASFEADATGVVEWKRKHNKQPPYSLQYFMQRKLSQQKAQSGLDIEDLVKHMANKMKL